MNTLPLLAVGRNPLLVVLVLGVAYPLWLMVGHQGNLFQSLPMLVALYALGGWSRPLWVRALGLAEPVWLVAAVLTGWWPGNRAPGTDLSLVIEASYVAAMFVLGWALGVLVAGRRSYIVRLTDKTVALEAARRELADRAVADERTRIARELHDVVAHAMSVITVRAGVGAHLIESRPTEAARALQVIEHTGREALWELRRMLVVLRDPGPRAPLPDPPPGLTDVPELVERVRAAGVTTTLAVDGEVQALPTGLDLAVYRLVQEALTNVVKHAPGAQAYVTIRYRPAWLGVEICNDGECTAPVQRGMGLRGMAERVALYDGSFDAGPHPDGFRVVARFPLDVVASGDADA